MSDRLQPLRVLPKSIWVLGFVSMCMDISSEMIHSLLPLFMVTVLGTSATVVGVVEGLAEATALIVKVFSGVLSDMLGRRKWLAVAGYGLGALTKPLFAVAGTTGLVLSARLIDRVGKGIRGAPRDALVADVTPPGMRGAAYGLRQSLDTVGAFAGPLLAVLLMLWTAGDFRFVFWVAVIPGVLAVALLVWGVREPVDRSTKSRKFPLHMTSLRRLGMSFWMVVVLGVVFSLARFSEAFLVLRAQQLGLDMAWVPMIMVVMNITYAASAYPSGALSDRLDRRGLMAAGCVVLLGADVVLALASHWTWAMLGVALWGVCMGMTQGLLSAWVADSVPAELRGTAFGTFNLACGLALLMSSIVAGLCWDRLGPASTFWLGAGLAALSVVVMLGAKRWHPARR